MTDKNVWYKFNLAPTQIFQFLKPMYLSQRIKNDDAKTNWRKSLVIGYSLYLLRL